MATTGDIAAMGYVSIRTADLNASVRSAIDVFGLHPVELTGQRAYLSAAKTHHELVFVKDDESAVDHFGLVAADAAALSAIRERVRLGGWKVVSESPLEDHIESGFAFVGPEGYTWHVYLGMSLLDYRSGSIGPDRYGHINMMVEDSVAMKNFLMEVFGFVVSDQIGEDFAFFLRCNPEHHGIAVTKAPPGGRLGLHHHAWQTQSIVDLGRLGDRLARAGERLIWGPVRHGAGHNIAAYYREPSGGIVELYTDMEFIYDPRREAIYWEADDLYWVNQWDGHLPQDFAAHLTAPYRRG